MKRYPHKTIKGFSETLQARREWDDIEKELKFFIHSFIRKQNAKEDFYTDQNYP